MSNVRTLRAVYVPPHPRSGYYAPLPRLFWVAVVGAWLAGVGFVDVLHAIWRHL